jgi:hypothetical protein
MIVISLLILKGIVGMNLREIIKFICLLESNLFTG